MSNVYIYNEGNKKVKIFSNMITKAKLFKNFWFLVRTLVGNIKKIYVYTDTYIYHKMPTKFLFLFS